MAALPGVITALVALFDAATTSDVLVLDGPEITGDRPTSYVMVGPPEDESASANFELSAMGPGTWQQESGEIVCELATGTGETDVDTARVTAFAILEQLRGALTADRSVTGSLALNGLGLIGRAALSYRQTSEGLAVVITFAVPYTTVLTS